MIHKIFFDGGTALHQVCIYDLDRKVYFTEEVKISSTNNQLEYLALLKAVRYAVSYYGSPRNVVFCGDSELIIKQMQDRYKVHRKHLKYVNEEVKKEFVRSNTIRLISNFAWVPRSKNLAGIVLEDLGKANRYVGRNN